MYLVRSRPPLLPFVHGQLLAKKYFLGFRSFGREHISIYAFHVTFWGLTLQQTTPIPVMPTFQAHVKGVSRTVLRGSLAWLKRIRSVKNAKTETRRINNPISTASGQLPVCAKLQPMAYWYTICRL